MKRKTWVRRKLSRKRGILKTIRKQRTGRFHPTCKQRRLWKVGAWNVRKWGATLVPYDPWTKTRVLFRLANTRGWHTLLLSDVSLADITSTQITVDNTKWTILVSGKVAIAMDETLTHAWTQGGGKRAHSPNGRSLLVLIPRAGQIPGIALVATYAPTSSASKASIQDFYLQCSDLLTKVPAGDILIIGGDFNAEPGQSLQQTHAPIFGPWPAPQTCEKCHKVLGSVMARKNHENRCYA